MLWFVVPDNTFYDPEDGDTSNLRLILQTFEDEHSLAPTSWIQLNETLRTLYGLPLDEDVGRQLFKLVAADSRGRLAKMTFEVYVPAPTHTQITHEFAVVLDLDYQQFLHKVTLLSSISPT